MKRGPTVSSSLIDKLIDEIDARLEHTHILVLSGSIPPGVPADIYRRLIRMAHRKDVKTVLDTAGEPFALGLEEKPFLVKPNSLEFEQTFKKDLKAGKGPLEVARSVIESTLDRVLCIPWEQTEPSSWIGSTPTGRRPFPSRPRA